MVALDAASLIRAGSGLLWLLLGLGVLALARDLRGRLLGAAAAGFGGHFVLFNLTVRDPATQMVAVTVSPALYAAGGVAALGLCWSLAPPGRSRRVAVGLAVASVAAGILRWSVADPNPFYAPETAAVYVRTDALFVFGQCALGALVWTAAGLHRRRLDAAAAFVALGFGIYLAYASGEGVLQAASAATAAALPDWRPAWAPYVYWGTSLAVLYGAAVAWLLAGGAARPCGRDVGLALFGAATLGAAASAFAWDRLDIAVGVLRTLGAALFAAAVFRHRFLDLPLPNLIARKGTVAAGALAVLFIVAQVAENFLSSEFGLLTGGVVAGAFLFAAQPLQRVAERLVSGPAEGGTAPSATARAEESYRAALRFALKDARLTADEERSLVVLAHDLGIPPRRAYELRDEVERSEVVSR